MGVVHTKKDIYENIGKTVVKAEYLSNGGSGNV